MGFGEIFGKSWQEYNVNLKSILAFLAVFALIPYIIYMILNLSLVSVFDVKHISSDSKINQDELKNVAGQINDLNEKMFNDIGSGENGTYKEQEDIKKEISELSTKSAELSAKQLNLILKLVPYFIISLIFGVIYYFVYYFGMIGVLVASYKERFSYDDAFKGAKKYYWKSIGLLVIFLIAFLIYAFAAMLGSILSVLLLAPVFAGIGVWLFISVIFSNYILVNENKGVFASIGESFNLVKGQWWRTFGRTLIFLLIMAGIFIILALPSMITGFSSILNNQYSYEIYSTGNFGIAIWGIITWLISSFFVNPFSIIFFKNFYITARKERNSNKGKKAGES